MSNLFHTLEIEAFRKGLTLRTKESREWFRRRVANLRPNRNELMKEEPVQLKNNSVIGNMYMFFYDPKTKDTMPYYDSFPLIIIVGKAKDGFYGLNLHYLPPTLRAKFLDSLLDVTNNKVYNETTKFEISYGMLQRAAKMKYFKPCFKHYLTSHVRSKFAMIESPEWEIATFLPTASWQKGTASVVYKDSKRKING
tara:strand:+ start:4792 stop:5379 length:588 start_codon:yes stop_codon:yes gene_type:complete